MIKTFLFDLFNIVNYELNHREKEIYNYFLEIALKVEFGFNPYRIVKWTKPMKIYISKKKKYKTQISYVKQVIQQINDLVSDGFRIELTEYIHQSNTIIYLGDKDKIRELANFFSRDFNEEFVGLADIEYDLSNYNILKAKIFIDTDETLDAQRAIILEEITQSIGLMNDSEIYDDSIFFQNKTGPNKNYHNHSDIDKELIKLLYLPSMKPGLNRRQVEKVIRRYYRTIKT